MIFRILSFLYFFVYLGLGILWMLKKYYQKGYLSKNVVLILVIHTECLKFSSTDLKHKYICREDYSSVAFLNTYISMVPQRSKRKAIFWLAQERPEKLFVCVCCQQPHLRGGYVCLTSKRLCATLGFLKRGVGLPEFSF